MSRIPLAAPCLGREERRAVWHCIASGWVSTAAPQVAQFEEEFAEQVGAKYCVATASGTAALHLALIALGIGRDEEVITNSLSFVAPSNAIRYVGAWPTYVDAEAMYWQIDSRQVEQFLTERCNQEKGQLRNRETGRLVTAFLIVDVLGHPADWNSLLRLAEQYKLLVIHDATESLGATYDQKQMGMLGDIVCFSFNGNKLLTTGSGGAVVTNDTLQVERMLRLAHQAKEPGLEYKHDEVGYNYRMSGLQAALGIAQLRKLDKFLDRKRAIRRRYGVQVDQIPGLQPMGRAVWADSSDWLNGILVDLGSYGEDSRSVISRLGTMGIETRPLWVPLHKTNAHRTSYAMDCPVAQQLHRDAVCLPSSVSLTNTDFTRVIGALEQPDRERGDYQVLF